MKPALREKLRAQLAGLDAGAVRAHSAAVWEHLAKLPEFKAGKCICAYVSAGKEIETHGLIRQLLTHHRRVCVPAFAGKYVPAIIHEFDHLVAGKFGILEPKKIIPGHPDVWLVPGLGFDKHGNRLGRGMGYYDALLHGAHGLKIGLAHDFQLQEHVPTEAHDIRLDYIVTEKQIVHCSHKP